MKPISSKLEKIEGKYYLNVPDLIVDLMGWSEGKYLLVPFHEIIDEQASSIKEDSNRKIPYQNKVKVNLRDIEIEIKRKDVIDLLDSPTPDLFVYRTAYIEWKGEKFGSKAICKKLLGRGDYTTQEGEWYLKKLGFLPKRTYRNY